MSDTIELLLNRRSSIAADLKEPGPGNEQLETLLRIAARVPDHGKLAPWRFIVFQGEARAKFGEELVEITRRNDPDAPPDKISFEANRLKRAPLVIAVVSAPLTHPKIPQWEQLLCAGAVCQNLLVAATAMGFGAQWITEWISYDEAVRAPLGLAENEKIAGFIYIGHSDGALEDRRRPELDQLITYWQDTE